MIKINPSEAFNLFKPESCVFVISADKEGHSSGMIAGWNMKCSKDPALFAVALSKKGKTHELIDLSNEFVVAVPNKMMEDDLLFFGSHSGSEIDKFEATRIETISPQEISVPLLKHATLNLECKVKEKVDSGDHYLYIGEIVAAHHNPGKKVLLNMKKIDGKRVFEEF